MQLNIQKPSHGTVHIFFSTHQKDAKSSAESPPTTPYMPLSAWKIPQIPQRQTSCYPTGQTTLHRCFFEDAGETHPSTAFQHFGSKTWERRFGYTKPQGWEKTQGKRCEFLGKNKENLPDPIVLNFCYTPEEWMTQQKKP